MPRKPLSDVPKTDTPLRIRLTDDERRRIDGEAAKTNTPTSTWARDLLLRATGKKRRVKASAA